jgi:hypothetical protein
VRTIEYTERLTVVTCWCGMHHAVPENLRDYQQRCHDEGRNVPDIFCPLGHSHMPAGQPLKDKLERRLAAEKERSARLAAQRDQAEASARAFKGAATRARRRAAAGVCPCCHRNFRQLRVHMSKMHPDYDPEAVTA